MNSSYAAPSLVNGIAFFVNGDPITLLELYSTMQSARISQDEAIDLLINKQLHEQEIKKRNIFVSDLDISNEIERIARQNKTSIENIRSYMRENGKDWNAYQQEIKDNLIKTKLYQSITQDSLKLTDEKDLQEYYNTHQEEFSMPQSIEVMKFYSEDSQQLEQAMRDQSQTYPDVFIENEILQTIDLSPQVITDFTQTKINAFTPIYPIDGQFVSFLILKKNNPTILPYELVKNKILQKTMNRKEDYIIYEHFEKLRSNAKINIIRLD
ncbi:peptidyl-prolyl cis-trans isomerase [Helicobacter mesocricetorum]|uniref:peptidyl-prolyl cis-trans isomerase n=1 Tax=Helicobacter mesocricetorum TaxID=87012 RepID=UPI001F35464A|nr:peptidyl-prolyl cis-trans isomerase [Helicobacter mesocricetorum]